MGVPGLWELVKDGSENIALQTLTVREGFEAKQDRLYVIGVDVSIWMRQLGHKFSVGHAQTGENPELKTFLFRLSTLADYPVHLVFVVDGPHRPKMKRGHEVKTTPPWLTEGMRNLVEAFGFDWVQAAGEGEAELAQMNRLGYIDAVMTEDGDALLFGAKTIIRNCELKRSEKHSVDVYRADRIATKVKLNRSDLLLYALLVGCDYDQIGLNSCGDQTARGLLRYGVGRQLFDVIGKYKNDDCQLRKHLDGWRDQVRACLRTDPRGFIGRAHRALADKMPSSFPSINVLHQFLSPALLPASSYPGVLRPRPIDFSHLGALCELHFGWGNRPQLLQKCRSLCWSNEVVRMLVMEGLGREERVQPAPPVRHLVGFTVEDVGEPPAFGYALCRLRIFDNGVAEAITSALRGLRVYRGTEAAPEERILIQAGRSSTFRLPAVIVERARPLTVNPKFTTEGYLYGRVHFNPAMRNGMKSSDRSLLTGSSSCHAAVSTVVGRTPAVVPVKDMILFRNRGMSRSASPGPSRAPGPPRASNAARAPGPSRVPVVVHAPQSSRAGARAQCSEGEIIDLTLLDSD